MSRCISTAIGLSWSDEQLQEKVNGIASAIKKVLAAVYPSSTLQ